MTKIGEYFEKKSISKAGVAKKTGISKSRISELSNNQNTNLKASELYLISLAIEADPKEILDFIFEDLNLKN